MIHITFTEPDTSEWRAWRVQCEEEQRTRNRCFQAGEPYNVRRDVYRGKEHGIKVNVFMSREGPFSGKCAYCEEEISRSQHGDMEHFRPMGPVRDAQNQPVIVIIEGEEKEHPGYYWLTYDWRNLLPSCALCNKQPSEDTPFGKGNRFPVAGNHAIREGEEGTEVPLLLNPVLDRPNEHLNLNKLGILEWKTDRGRVSVEILGLNERDLSDARLTTYHEGRDTYAALLHALSIDSAGAEAQRLTQKVRSILDGKTQHAMAGRKGIADAKEGAAGAP